MPIITIFLLYDFFLKFYLLTNINFFELYIYCDIVMKLLNSLISAIYFSLLIALCDCDITNSKL